MLRKERVSPSAWVWVHAQNERNSEIHVQVARAGGWVEFDGVGPTSIDRHVELVKTMQSAGLLNHVLLSHDAGWYCVGEPRGGNVRGFDTVFTTFVPALLRAGLGEDEIKQVTVNNPAKAFAIGSQRT